MADRQKRAITLTELLIAILLLGTVVVTAVTLELSLRRMQIKPSDDAKMLDELIPVTDRIGKDFDRQIGSLINTSLSIEESGRRLVIRVDADNSGLPSAGDEWHAYRWNGTPGGPIEYSPNNTTFSDIVAQGITEFVVTPLNNNTIIQVRINTRKNPDLSENILTNPAVNLTTSFFSRMTSGR